LRQRRDGAADRQPRDGRAVRQRRRPGPGRAAHDDRSGRVVAERGTELVAWYLDQQRERARLVWRDYDPETVPPDYQGYYARDQRLASGPHPGEPTPEEVREQGTKFCVGTPADCIRFLEIYEALGIEEVFLLCAIGPAQHEEVMHTIRLFGEQIIPHFQAKTQRAAAAVAAN
jgi:alkanesulfonate monooxygenase SsuD/methylene tetrahydromethanopterin reductase-like flavin-dependent oxidoreductase (luciferase family)